MAGENRPFLHILLIADKERLQDPPAAPPRNTSGAVMAGLPHPAPRSAASRLLGIYSSHLGADRASGVSASIQPRDHAVLPGILPAGRAVQSCQTQ